jgi:TonB family protein
MSQSQQPAQQATGGLPPTVIEIIAQEEQQDKRLMRMSVGAAVVIHIIMFIMHWPSFAASTASAKERKSKIYVVKQVKFKQPPPQQLQQQIPKPVTKRVPIPDPTPDEPEPIRDEQTQRDDFDFVPDDNLVLGVPDAPPPAEPEGPIRFVVGGNITEPVKLSGPNPIYPEAARRARIQGVVVLECIIAKDGAVREAKVLRGLPLGLTEAAVDAVKKWKFQPSTLNDKPVEVLYILTVRFNLQ